MLFAFSKAVVKAIPDFEHSVAQIPDAATLRAEAFVLRVDGDLWIEIGSQSSAIRASLASQAKAVAERAPGIAIYLMPDAHSCAEARPAHTIDREPILLVDRTGALSLTAASAAVVASIRERDLAECIEASWVRCVICAASDYHFALPSGAHSNQFLRLAEAFVDLPTVDRMAYWVALRIEHQLAGFSAMDPVLLVDHPSMLVLASRVQLLVSAKLQVVAFPTYPSDVEARTAAFDQLQRLPTSCSHAFVLIGVASTGRLARFIDLWARATRVRVDVAILFAVHPLGSMQVLCELELPDYKHYGSKDECDLCKADSHPVTIQSSNYMVGFGPAESAALPPSFFERQKGFIQRWGGHKNVLRVHYDDPNEASRHHAFYVDVATLLDIPDFVDELKARVRQLEPPQVVVAPDHVAAQRIAQIISGELGIPIVLLDLTMLARGLGPVDPHLHAAASVLVVDDVFITGSKLDAINKFLREQHDTRAPNVVRIQFFTLLATPPSPLLQRRRVNALISHHGWHSSVEHFYEFPLPDWHHGDQCPWCRERSVLQRIARHQDDLESAVAGRLSVLANTQAGLTDEAFFLIESLGRLPDLGAQSAVASTTTTPIQVLIACASALQQLRHADKQRLDFAQFPSPTYLAERVFTNYSERLIWLGLLRSLRVRELEPSLRSVLRRVALNGSDQQRVLVHNELAIAWLVGKLDAIEVSKECRRFFGEAGISWDALFEVGFVDGSPD